MLVSLLTVILVSLKSECGTETGLYLPIMYEANDLQMSHQATPVENYV